MAPLACTLKFVIMTWPKAASLVVIMIGFASCKQIDPSNQLTFQVTNKTKETIDYLSFSTNKGQGKTVNYAVPEDAAVNVNFDFGQIDKTDGGYQLTYKLASSADTLIERFGYYTNGSPTEKALVLKVYRDSISVDRIPFGSY